MIREIRRGITVIPLRCLFHSITDLSGRSRYRSREQQKRLTRSQRKESITMEENKRRNDQEDPTPLTDEELEQFQKKEKRKITIIGDIIDFILSFFQ